MRSRPTTISPEKFFRTSSVHMASVMEGSSPGTKWLSTSVLDPRLGSHVPQLHGGGVAVDQMLAQSRRIGIAGKQAVETTKVHRFVHTRQLPLARRSAPVNRWCRREYDRAVRRIEPIGVGVSDGG